MNTSEVDTGNVSSKVNSDLVTSGDTIYQGINFSALKRELTPQKLWRERTWKEILRHFITALIFGTLGSFIDIGTDGLTAKSFIWGTNYTKWVKNLSEPANHDDCVHTGRYTSSNPGPEIEYEEIVCFEQDPIWGWVTVGFIFLPGYHFAFEVAKTIMEILGKKSFYALCLLYVCLIFPCLILFPPVLIVVKLVYLINPGPECKRVNTRITGMEGSWESAYQTILTLFIIFTRADRQPSSVQIASLIASFAMLTKTAIADYLSPKQPLKLKDELKATASLLPLFLSHGVAKLLSLAIIITCLRKIAMVPFFVVAIGYVLRRKASCCAKRCKDPAGEEFCEYHYTTMKGDCRATKRQKMESCLLNNIFWGIFHVIILTSLVTVANSNLDSFNYTVTDHLDFSNNGTEQNQSMSRVQSVHISKRPGLVENLPLLNGLFVGILSAMATNALLFYFQMWKPMVEEEEMEQRESAEKMVKIG